MLVNGGPTILVQCLLYTTAICFELSVKGSTFVYSLCCIPLTLEHPAMCFYHSLFPHRHNSYGVNALHLKPTPLPKKPAKSIDALVIGRLTHSVFMFAY